MRHEPDADAENPSVHLAERVFDRDCVIANEEVVAAVNYALLAVEGLAGEAPLDEGSVAVDKPTYLLELTRAEAIEESEQTLDGLVGAVVVRGSSGDRG